MMTLTLKNTNSPLSNMMVRIVEKGDGYGQYNQKTEKFAFIHEKRDPLVEFYDLDYERKPFGGQFVSRYYMSTLLERDSGGLCLDGGERKWNVNENEMNQVRQFLRAAQEQFEFAPLFP